MTKVEGKCQVCTNKADILLKQISLENLASIVLMLKSCLSSKFLYDGENQNYIKYMTGGWGRGPKPHRGTIYSCTALK